MRAFVAYNAELYLLRTGMAPRSLKLLNLFAVIMKIMMLLKLVLKLTKSITQTQYTVFHNIIISSNSSIGNSYSSGIVIVVTAMVVVS